MLGTGAPLGWLSAIPNVPVAHELGHRHGPMAQLLADVMAIFFGDPGRWVSHNLGHHLKVGTTQDSDTPFRGERVYRFVWRASRGALGGVVVLHHQRGMVGVTRLRVHLRAAYLSGDAGGDNLVVDAPAHVLGPCLAPV